MIPWFSRGIRYVQRSLEIRRELDDLWGQGQSLSFYGVVLYGASRYRECIDACEEAARILAGTGDRWEMNTARWHIAFSHYRLGDLDLAAAIAADVYREANAIGDNASAGIALSAWARATAGDVPAEAVAAALARHHEDVHTATEARSGRGHPAAADRRGPIRSSHPGGGGSGRAGCRPPPGIRHAGVAVVGDRPATPAGPDGIRRHGTFQAGSPSAVSRPTSHPTLPFLPEQPAATCCENRA